MTRNLILAILFVMTSASLKDAEAVTSPCGSAYPHCVILTWSYAPNSSDSVAFRVYRSVSGGPFQLLKGGMTTPKYKDTNVSSGVTYAYEVSAWDKTIKVEGAASNVATATVP